VRGEQRVVVPPAAASARVLKLGQGAEFFLVENRGPDAPWDLGMTARGLVVQHVNLRRLPSPADNSFLTTIVHCVNCDAWDPMLMLEQADGRFDLQMGLPSIDEDDLFRDGDALRPAPAFPGRLAAENLYFSSDRYDGRPTGVEIRDVDTQSMAPDIVVTLVAPTASPDPCLDVNCAAGFHCDGGRCVPGDPPTPTASPTPTPSVTASPATPTASTSPPPPASGGGCRAAIPSPAGLCIGGAISAIFCGVRRRRRTH
jgi:hypothetical protein